MNTTPDPAGRFAVYDNGYHTNKRDPSRWGIIEVGRETPKRLYHNATKGSRFRDPYTRAEDVVARFDSREAAVAFIVAAREVYASHEDAVAEADLALNVAKDRLASVKRKRADAVVAFAAERGVSIVDGAS